MIPAALLGFAHLLSLETAVRATLPCDYVDCPQVYLVHKADYAQAQLNLVFLPDGFTEAQLGEFRCAVKLLSDALLDVAPFDRYACRTNVYRMDLYTVESGIEALCGTRDDLEDADMKDLCASEFSVLGDPLYPYLVCDSEPRTFGTRTCVSNVERLMWPTKDGEKDALDLANRCAPSPSAVIIIGRSEANAGGGDTVIDRTLGLAAVSLRDIEKPSRAHRLAHELGHALGLLDEYSKSGVEAPYSCGRNLFTLDSDLVPDPSACEKEPRWAADCEPLVTSGTAGKCETCPGEYGCQKVCCIERSADCGEIDSPVKGVYEGGHYQACDVFHSAATCRMEDLSYPACSVCNRVVSARLRDAGVPHCRPIIVELATPNELLARRAIPLRLTHCRPKPPPVPPPPYGDDRRAGGGPSTGFGPPQSCPGVFRQVRAWTAEVEADGIVGEVPIRRASMEIRPRKDGEAPFVLELERTAGAGTDRVVWRRSGVEIGQDTPLGNPDEDGALVLGDLVGDITVEDEVRGTRWKARSIRWD